MKFEKKLKNFFEKNFFREILEKIIKKWKKNQFFSKLQIVLEYRVLRFLLESKCKTYLKSIIFQFLNILNVKNDSEKNGAMMKFDAKWAHFCVFGAFCCLTRPQSGRDWVVNEVGWGWKLIFRKLQALSFILVKKSSKKT